MVRNLYQTDRRHRNGEEDDTKDIADWTRAQNNPRKNKMRALPRIY